MIESTPRRVWRIAKDFGIYLAALLALVLFVQYQKEAALKDFRKEVNTVAQRLCVQNQADPFPKKHNTLIDALIDDLQRRRQENILKGDFAKANINADTITQLSKTYLTISKVDCSQPLLTGGGD